MYVIKRNGRKEQVMFDKITSRINKLSYGLDPNYVQPFKIAQKVINGLYEGVTTAELDELAAEECATMTKSILIMPFLLPVLRFPISINAPRKISRRS